MSTNTYSGESVSTDFDNDHGYSNAWKPEVNLIVILIFVLQKKQI
jgi:hypothetical protein